MQELHAARLQLLLLAACQHLVDSCYHHSSKAHQHAQHVAPHLRMSIADLMKAVNGLHVIAMGLQHLTHQLLQASSVTSQQDWGWF